MSRPKKEIPKSTMTYSFTIIDKTTGRSHGKFDKAKAALENLELLKKEQPNIDWYLRNDAVGKKYNPIEKSNTDIFEAIPDDDEPKKRRKTIKEMW